ncbi:hypothetical protein GCM10020219_040650 [Nonomuraea dietziae]
MAARRQVRVAAAAEGGQAHRDGVECLGKLGGVVVEGGGSPRWFAPIPSCARMDAFAASRGCGEPQMNSCLVTLPGELGPFVTFWRPRPS